MAKRINKYVTVSKHIHSSNSSWSSNDVWVEVNTTLKELDFAPEANTRIVSKKFPMLDGQFINEVHGDKLYLELVLESEKKFNNGRFSLSAPDIHKSPEFLNLIQSYIDKGFVKHIQTPEQKAYRDRKEALERIKDKKQGLVLWMGFEALKENPKLFQGGFSDEVFNSPGIQNYVSRGVAYGWIGHSGARTATHDKQIEAGLRKRGISPFKMFNWITSFDGRHFADSLEGYTKKEQKQKIAKYLNFMFNRCLIYGLLEHEGTLNSIIKIEEMLSSYGITLPGGGKFNKNNYLKNLLSVQKSISEKTSLTEGDKIVNDLVTTLFISLA